MNTPWSSGESRRELAPAVSANTRNQILMYFTAAIIWLAFGASRLGLLGGGAVDNSWTSHLVAAGFLVAGGVFATLGVQALQARLNSRKAA